MRPNVTPHKYARVGCDSNMLHSNQRRATFSCHQCCTFESLQLTAQIDAKQSNKGYDCEKLNTDYASFRFMNIQRNKYKQQPFSVQCKWMKNLRRKQQMLQKSIVAV